MVHKKDLNQTKSSPYLEKLLRQKEGIQRGSPLTRKGKDIESVPCKSKKRVLYTLSLNINGYIPFFVNTLDTIVK